MATSKGKYLGELRTENIHLHSGQVLITDAPLDNQGLAEAFSPTDLVATAYADCIITIMGIKARDKSLDLSGTTYEVTKVMYDHPRRIGEIHIAFSFPARDYSQKDRKILEAISNSCPVAKSIHPDIKRVVTFQWK